MYEATDGNTLPRNEKFVFASVANHCVWSGDCFCNHLTFILFVFHSPEVDCCEGTFLFLSVANWCQWGTKHGLTVECLWVGCGSCP